MSQIDERNPIPKDPAESGAPQTAPRWAIIGIFLLLLLGAVAMARDFLLPVVLAMMLTLVFTPLRRWLSRMGVPSWACAVLVVFGLGGGVLAGVSVLAQPVADWVSRGPQIGFQIEQKLRDLRLPIEKGIDAVRQIDELTEVSDDKGAEKVELRKSGFSDRIAETLPAIAAQLVFILILMFFLIVSGDMFYEKLVHIMPTFTDKRRAVRIALDIERTLSRYFSTISLINALLGLGVGIAMWAFGMPTPVLFGLMAFILNFIPYVGAVFGIILTTLIALISLPTPFHALAVGGTYLLLNSIEGQFITPYFVGRVLQMNTVIVFVAIAFWAWLWSVVGMIIAVPMLVVVRVLSEHIDPLRPIGELLSARGVRAEPEPEVAPASELVGEEERG